MSVVALLHINKHFPSNDAQILHIILNASNFFQREVYSLPSSAGPRRKPLFSAPKTSVMYVSWFLPDLLPLAMHQTASPPDNRTRTTTTPTSTIPTTTTAMELTSGEPGLEAGSVDGEMYPVEDSTERMRTELSGLDNEVMGSPPLLVLTDAIAVEVSAVIGLGSIAVDGGTT